MGDFENKLNELLNSPESLEQIMNLARSLSGGETDNSEKDVKQESPKSQNTQSQNTQNAQSTSSPLSGLDPRLMGMLGSALKEYGAPSENDALISAIKPYLKQDRREKVEKAIQIAKLAKIAKSVIPDIGGPNNV